MDVTDTVARDRAAGVLGVSPACDRRTARRAYRRLAAVHHPDRGGDAAAFRRIHEAWETISRLVPDVPTASATRDGVQGQRVRIVNAHHRYRGGGDVTVGRLVDVAA